MSLVIQTNVASLMAQQNLTTSQAKLSGTFNQLSSGYRINTSADDAAGLAISDNMNMQVLSYTVAGRNANDAVSMSQTADGALGQVTNILGRMQQLAMEGANGDMTTNDRSYLSTEFSSLQNEITRILTSTKFNGQSLITNASNTIAFQVGITNASTDRISVTFGGISLSALTIGTKVGGSAGNSQSAIGELASALTVVSTARARFGAAINRFQDASSNIQTMSVNIQSAESRVKDVDVAAATAQLSQEQVLQQAGTAVLAQANQAPQLALKLLGG